MMLDTLTNSLPGKVSHLLDSKRFMEWFCIALVLLLMFFFGIKILSTPLYSVAGLIFVMLLIILFYNIRLATYILLAGLVAFEEHTMGDTFIYFNPEPSSILMEMRIAGVGLIDAVTLLFLIPVLLKEFILWYQERKKFFIRSDLYFIPLFIAFTYGAITGSFSALSLNQYFGDLRILFYVVSFYFVVSRTFRTKQHVAIALVIIIATFFLKTLFFVYRYASGGGVLTGYDYRRIALGSDIPMMAIFTLTFVIAVILTQDQPMKKRIFLFLAVGYASFFLVSSLGRTTYIFTVVSLLLLYVLLRRQIPVQYIFFTLGVGTLGGLIFYFFVMNEVSRELLTYALSSAFNWSEAIQVYGDLSIGERLLEMINIWTNLMREGAVLWGLGWGASWREIAVHHPFNNGSFAFTEQISGIHTSAHVDAIHFLLKVGIIGVLLIYASHVAFVKRALQLFRQQALRVDKISILVLLIMLVIIIPNYLYFVKLKLLLGVVFGCVAVFSEASLRESCV